MIFAVPIWGSEVANSKTDIPITNTASEVMWCNAMSPPLNTRGRSANRQCLKGTLDVPALNYVTSLGICYFVWWRLSGDHADGR